MGLSGTLRLKQVVASRSRGEVEQAALLAASHFGFRYFMFWGCFSAQGESRDVRFDNFPVEWHRYCVARGRDLLPGSLRRRALQEVTPMLWSKSAPPRDRSFAKARECGLATGVSCSVRGPQAQWSLTSFALPHDGPAAERRIVSALPDCQLLACAIHYAAARVAGRSLDGSYPARRLSNELLSERESQCLIESARGKTTSEIAQALQISERTVAFHLANVRRKLDAANSRHAVTKALSLRLIAAG
jgi:LuxR family transcriptional activator of conjugal transfer of Ti plasmids